MSIKTQDKIKKTYFPKSRVQNRKKMGGQSMPQAEELKYFDFFFRSDSKMEEGTERCILVLSALMQALFCSVFENKQMSQKVKKSKVLPTAISIYNSSLRKPS
ncbi:hypothetical protein ILYODFUR_009008 [Ilyodon furcidens]|uniref:Uncharacterized protein n=1 Tax=Ilyodon furcidens TaxID=33524 RepID=A0ABV0TT65_9TELE